MGRGSLEDHAAALDDCDTPGFRALNLRMQNFNHNAPPAVCVLNVYASACRRTSRTSRRYVRYHCLEAFDIRSPKLSKPPEPASCNGFDCCRYGMPWF